MVRNRTRMLPTRRYKVRFRKTTISPLNQNLVARARPIPLQSLLALPLRPNGKARKPRYRLRPQKKSAHRSRKNSVARKIETSPYQPVGHADGIGLTAKRSSPAPFGFLYLA